MAEDNGKPDITFGGVTTDAGSEINSLRAAVLGMATSQLNEAKNIRSDVKADLSSIADRTFNLAATSDAPTAPNLLVDTGVEFTNPTLGLSDFGSIREITAVLGARGSITAPAEVTIDPFSPSVTSLNIPEAPAAAAPVTPPSKPATNTVVMPTPPVLEKPASPYIEDIIIPTFEFPTIEAFDKTAPVFQDTPVATILDWDNPQYATEIIDEVVGKLRDLWAGGSGIPAAIEFAIWERAAGREDLDANRQVSEAFTEFSSRGFTAPPGMLAARTDAIREESAIKKQGLSRDVAIRMAEISVDNIKFAVEQGIAAENVLFNIWNNMAARLFEMAKINLDSKLALYNARVALYNAGQQAYAIEAEVYKAKLQADLAEIEVYKAELEGVKAKGDANSQRVAAYEGQIRALQADVAVYDSKVRAAIGETEVNRAIIEGYRVDVQAYAESVTVDKNRYDAYNSRVQGELGKAQLLDAEARAYSSYVSGQATVADIGIKRMEADIARNLEVFREFEANLEAEKAAIEADAAKISAHVAAYTADTQRVEAEASVEESKNRVKIAAKDVELRASIGLFEVEVRKYVADMEQMLQRVGVQIEALKASSQVGATMAAGAMAGINIGANIGGQSSQSVSASESDANSAIYSYQGVG